MSRVSQSRLSRPACRVLPFKRKHYFERSQEAVLQDCRRKSAKTEESQERGAWRAKKEERQAAEAEASRGTGADQLFKKAKQASREASLKRERGMT